MESTEVKVTTQLENGTELVLWRKYVSASPEGLLLKRGDIVRVVRPTRKVGWYVICNATGETSKVSVNNYMDTLEVFNLSQAMAMPWYHGSISRPETEALFAGNPACSFLVRDSNKHPGSYTLCIRGEGKIIYYQINSDHWKFWIQKDHTATSLAALIQYYRETTSNLNMKGARGIHKEHSVEYCVDADIFLGSHWSIALSDLENVKRSDKMDKQGNIFQGDFQGSQVTLKQADPEDSRSLHRMAKEAHLLASLRHENVVTFQGVVMSSPAYIVMENLTESEHTFHQLLSRRTIDDENMLKLSIDICKGMAHLEDKGVIHCDLAARNIIISGGTAKVANFHLARPARFAHAREDEYFPIRWLPPDALKARKFTSKSDVWSFGVVMWEIYSYGETPYPQYDLSDVMVRVQKGKRMGSPGLACPSDVYAVMTDTWQENPDSRSTFSDILCRLRNLASPDPEKKVYSTAM